MSGLTPAAIVALAKGEMENFIVAATPGGIEAQEKRGQLALCASTNMPTDLSPDKETFEKIGFTFGEKIDDIFMQATLPVGWTRAATGHSMHSAILDEQGRKRVGVFYKAAFYDRRADAYLLRRYTVGALYGDIDENVGIAKDERATVVFDAGKEIHRVGVAKRDDYDTWDKLDERARAWLTKRFPDCESVFAYW